MSITDARRRRALHAVAGLIGLLAVTPAAQGSGLQVSPVLVTITERSAILKLSNVTTDAMRAQVRVFRWDQVEGMDRLRPTDDVLASPPMIDVGGNGRQIVRLVRREMTSAQGGPCETAYRLRVDELPAPKMQPSKSGLDFRMSYSIPLFVTAARCRKDQPRLSWRIGGEGASRTLTVANGGSRHAQLAAATIIGRGGQRQPISQGLMGYVLPGSSMHFPVRGNVQIPAEGMIEVMINGQKASWPVRSAASGQ